MMLSPVLDRKCGPDVTDEFVKALIKVMEAVANDSVTAYFKVAPGSDADFKGDGDARADPDNYKPRVKTEDCPTNCASGITLCEKCVSDQVPGNIALGTFGARAASVIGSLVSGESSDDRTSYGIGEGVFRQFHDYPPWHGFGPSAKAAAPAAVKAALCKAIEKVVTDKCPPGEGRLTEYPCAICGDPSPPRQPKPRPTVPMPPGWGYDEFQFNNLGMHPEGSAEHAIWQAEFDRYDAELTRYHAQISEIAAGPGWSW